MNDLSYNNWASMSDKGLMEMIGKFVQHNRLNQNRSQTEVAKAANISRSTLSLLERGEKTALSSLIQVLRILDLLYIMDIFKVQNEISPVAYARLQKKERLRAGHKGNTLEAHEDLQW